MLRGWRPASRRAKPYNTYVQHERQQKYYTRKKTLSKFKRLQKYEGKQSSGQDEGQRSLFQQAILQGEDGLDPEYERRLAFSFGEQAILQGEDGLDPEYERRLAFSFGEQATLEATKAIRAGGIRPKLSNSQKRAAAALAANPDQKRAAVDKEGSSSSMQPDARRRKAKEANVAATEEASTGVASGKDVQPAVWPDRSKAEEAVPGKKPAKHKRRKGAAADDVPVRFSREMHRFQEEQAAKEAERQRIRQEILERNRKKREFRKGRAIKGELLSQRTARGQPRMQSMLEAVTAKLKQELDTRAPK